MSDALSEIARDQDRENELQNFYLALTDYLENPSDGKLADVKKSAENTDSVGGGYLGGGRTNILKNLERKMGELSNGDKTAWAKLLIGAYARRYEGEFHEGEIYSRLKKLSPYADKILLHVDYGIGFSNIKRTMEFQEAVDDKIKSSGMKVLDADQYLLAFDKNDFEKFIGRASVDWVHCGINGVCGPRKSKER